MFRAGSKNEPKRDLAAGQRGLGVGDRHPQLGQLLLGPQDVVPGAFSFTLALWRISTVRSRSSPPSRSVSNARWRYRTSWNDSLQRVHIALQVLLGTEGGSRGGELGSVVEQTTAAGDRKLLLERQELVADAGGVLHLIGDLGIRDARLDTKLGIDGSLDHRDPSSLGALLQEDSDRVGLGHRTARPARPSSTARQKRRPPGPSRTTPWTDSSPIDR